MSYISRSSQLGGEKRFLIDGDGNRWTHTRVIFDNRLIVCDVSMSTGSEADLALCLAALVAEGVLDIEKLRAALVLAEPVAKELHA